MSRIHLTIGVISIIIIAIVGMFTRLVSIGEGIIIMLIILVAAPIFFDILRRTRKHDER